MRKILGVHWPEIISNEDLYDRCRTGPISDRIVKQRWNLFGHILRRDSDIPGQTAMTEYFQNNGPKYRGRTPTSLPTALNEDLRNLTKIIKPNTPNPPHQLPTKLTDTKDLEKLKIIAQDRDQWRLVTKHNLQRLPQNKIQRDRHFRY